MNTPMKAPVEYKRLALDYVDSTNSEAIRHAKAGADEGLWVTSKAQSAGRGRRGRQWSSLDGNLFASLLLRPAASPQMAANISFVASLAVSDVIIDCLNKTSPINVKWPNDVLVNGKKISGILLESAVKPDRSIDYLVVGIGINITSSPDDTPYGSTSLLAQASPVTADDVMHKLEIAFDHWYTIWCQKGFEAIREAWLLRADHIDKPIVVRTGDQEIHGVFRDLSPSGALILDVEGDMREIHAGDVFPAQDG